MSRYHVSILLLLAGFAGCRSHGVLVKRESELNCPTDIRQTVPWCAGEDAIFRCPCGPGSDFYGHKPTCWRTWPAPAAVWRDAHCSCFNPAVVESGSSEVIILPPVEASPEPVEAIEGLPSTNELLPTTSGAASEGMLPQEDVRRQFSSAARRAQPRKMRGIRPASYASGAPIDAPHQSASASVLPAADIPDGLSEKAVPAEFNQNLADRSAEAATAVVELPPVEEKQSPQGSSSAFLEAVGRATNAAP